MGAFEKFAGDRRWLTWAESGGRFGASNRNKQTLVLGVLERVNELGFVY
jgi:hypothetical protein